MKKKEFLSILEEKLEVLNKEEREDILNEYKDTISEKVKNGQTEEEAIKDFGDIDDLARELLSAYKINPEYGDKSILEEGEHLVKRGADKLASATKDLYHRFESSNKEINLSLVFEILIKIFLVILALAILRLPFMLFEDLGRGVFDAFFTPFNDILMFIWKLCLMALYLVVCVLVVIAVFKRYFEGDKVEINNKEEIKDKNETKEKKEVKNTIKNEVKKERTGSTVGEVLLLCVKLCVILFVIVPLAFMDFFVILGICFSIYYLFQGINFWGLTILLIGVAILITYMIKLIYNLVFKKKGLLFVIPIIGIVLVALGSFMFFDMVMNIDYIDDYPHKRNMETKEETFTISHDEVYLNYIRNFTKEVDDTLADNQIRVEVNYDKKIYDVNLEHNGNYVDSNCEYDEFGNENCTDKIVDTINIDLDNYDNFDEFQDEYNTFIDNLKDNKVYSYNRDNLLEVKVFANSKTISKITNY